MPLYAIPVVLPFRMRADAGAAIYTMHLEAVASGNPAAEATAKAIVKTVALLQFGRPPAQILNDRIQIGHPKHVVRGAYCYIFGRSHRVPHLALPARLEGEGTTELDALLTGLHHDQVRCVIMDAAPLQAITSAALSALVSHSQAINLHLCRLPPAIEDVVTTTGLHKVLNLHPDLPSALSAVAATGQDPLLAMSRRR